MSFVTMEMNCQEQDGGVRMCAKGAPSRDRIVATGGLADRVLGDAVESQPSSRGFIAMLEVYRATGGMAPGNFLCQSLQEHQRGDLGQLGRLIEDRRVFVLDWRGVSWIPMFQFDGHDLSCKTGPALVRAELSGLDSGWAIAGWFARPNAQLGGRLPVNVVELDLEAVLDAARSRAPLPEPQRRMATCA